MELSADTIRDWQRQLVEASLSEDRTPESDAARVDLLRALEGLKATGCAVQARVTVDFDTSQRAQQAARGVSAKRQGRGVATQVALARRESPNRGTALVSLARSLVADLPHTYAALREGRLSERRAQTIASACADLDPGARGRVDDDLCADPMTIHGLGNKQLFEKARGAAAKADPAAAEQRYRRALRDRRVTSRPAPDGMMWISALVPMIEGVAAMTSLKRRADQVLAKGDPQERTHGAIMADTLIERLTGQVRAEDVGIQVDLVMSDQTLLGGGDEPAHVPGHGIVPAAIARHLLARALDLDLAWLRRLYADPAGKLVAMSTNQRFTTEGLSAFLRLRDQGICRTPWCDAPIRHVDHVEEHDEGGPTSEQNTQGTCEACNYVKQTPGWRHRVVIDHHGRHTVEILTPTGHRYTSEAPAPPRPARDGPVTDIGFLDGRRTIRYEPA